MAAILGQACQKISGEDSYDPNREFVITVPSYSPPRYQLSLHNACIIAQNIPKARLLDESTATIYNYAREQYTNLIGSQKSEKIETFIDIGHSKTTVTVAKFTRNQDELSAEILAHKSDPTLGGRECDYLVLETAMKWF